MVFPIQEERRATHKARSERESSAVASSLKTELFLPSAQEGVLFSRLEQVMGKTEQDGAMSTFPGFLSCDIEAFSLYVGFEACVHCMCNRSQTQNDHRRMSAWLFDVKVDYETIKL